MVIRAPMRKGFLISDLQYHELLTLSSPRARDKSIDKSKHHFCHCDEAISPLPLPPLSKGRARKASPTFEVNFNCILTR